MGWIFFRFAIFTIRGSRFWEKRGCKNVENTLRLTVKITWRIPDAKYLIKPVENEDFWSPFSGNDYQNDQKALPREGFRNAFSERRETL